MRKDMKKAMGFVDNAVGFLEKVTKKTTTPSNIREEVDSIIDSLQSASDRIDKVRETYGA